MVDAKTIETFLKEANGSLQPAHRTILEDFLTTSKSADKLKRTIAIEIEDKETLKRQYGDRAKHELDIQQYRINILSKGLVRYQDLERQSEEIMKLYVNLPTHISDAETHPASLAHIGGV